MRKCFIFDLSLALLATMLALLPVNAVYGDTFRIDDTDPRVTYTANSWLAFGYSPASGGSVATAYREGSTATLTFEGTGVSWVGFRCSCAEGTATVLLDGAYVTSLSTGGTSVPQQKIIYSVSGLAPGTHTFTIAVTGNHDWRKNNVYIVLDAFDVVGNDGSVTRVEETDPRVSYASNFWPSIFDDRASGGSVAATYERGARVTADFIGAGITWVGFRCSCIGGIVDLYLDGAYIATVDTYAPNTEPQQQAIYSVNNLVPGRHTFTIAVTGTYNSEATNSYVVVDAFDVDTGGGPPADGPPVVTMTAPANGSEVNGTITVKAEAEDDTGIKYMELYMNNRLYPGAISSSSNSAYDRQLQTQWDTKQLPDGLYKFFATASDPAGHWSSSSLVSVHVNNCIKPGTTCIEEDSPQIVYSGGWQLAQSSALHEGAARYSDAVGDSLTFTFQGTRTRLFGLRCLDYCGDADVLIDGEVAEPVSTVGGRDLGQPGNITSQLYETPVLNNGTHTLQLTVKARVNPGLVRVYVDRFEVDAPVAQ